LQFKNFHIFDIRFTLITSDDTTVMMNNLILAFGVPAVIAVIGLIPTSPAIVWAAPQQTNPSSTLSSSSASVMPQSKPDQAINKGNTTEINTYNEDHNLPIAPSQSLHFIVPCAKKNSTAGTGTAVPRYSSATHRSSSTAVQNSTRTAGIVTTTETVFFACPTCLSCSPAIITTVVGPACTASNSAGVGANTGTGTPDTQGSKTGMSFHSSPTPTPTPTPSLI